MALAVLRRPAKPRRSCSRERWSCHTVSNRIRDVIHALAACCEGSAAILSLLRTPMRTLLPLIAVFLCSCEINHYTAKSVAGNYVHEDNYQLGGTRSNSRSDGSSYANDYQKSFQDGTSAVVTLGAGIVAGQVNKAKNAATALTQQQAQQQASAQALAKTAAEAAAAKTAAQTELLKANPQAIVPATTILNAP